VDLLRFTSDGFDLEVEIGIKARAHQLRSITIPIHYQERRGEKKLHAWRDGWHLLGKVLALTPFHHPALAFVLPGVLVWIITALMTRGVSSMPGVVPDGQVDLLRGLILALGAAAGFQFVIFGIATALEGIADGLLRHSRLQILGRRHLRVGLGALALILATVGIATVLILDVQGLVDGVTLQLRELELGGILLLVGLQILVAVMFISIFASRHQETDAAVTALGVTGPVTPRLIEPVGTGPEASHD
jgi:hypothetical protein